MDWSLLGNDSALGIALRGLFMALHFVYARDDRATCVQEHLGDLALFAFVTS